MVTDAYSDAFSFLCYLHNYYGSPLSDAYDDTYRENLEAFRQLSIRGMSPREFWLPIHYRETREAIPVRPHPRGDTPFDEIGDEAL